MNSIASHLLDFFNLSSLEILPIEHLDAKDRRFNLDPPFLDLFDRLQVLNPGAGEISLVFTVQPLPVRIRIEASLKLLFDLYGPDSNEYSFLQIPNVGPFGEEIYDWMVDEQGRKMYENEDFHHSLEFYISDVGCELTIEKAHVLVELPPVLLRG
jgi:hypothetical protein